MRVAHIAPYAPGACGLYEAARDMARADTMQGHEVVFVDCGADIGGVRQETKVGAVHDVGGFCVNTAPPTNIEDCDLIVLHSGCPVEWLGEKPIVVIVHTRPLAAYRFERAHPGAASFTFPRILAALPNTRALVSMWPEHARVWRHVIGPKLVTVDWPPIDLERYAPTGERIEIPEHSRGLLNGLICESEREDVDLMDTLLLAADLAAAHPGLKWHVIGLEQSAAHGPLLEAIATAGGLGMISQRIKPVEIALRAMDFLLTPQRIVTRSVGEAMACGLPVIRDWSGAAEWMIREYMDSPELLTAQKQAARASAERRFNLSTWGERMTAIYTEAIGG